MKYNIEELMKSINLQEDIKASDIPDIDLYMEQLTNFIDTNLEGQKRNKEDKILTKTMINSYTKDGLLMAPKNKKKYTKSHIILLILIYHLKQILTINDIKILLKPILKDIDTENDDIIPMDHIYNLFLQMKNEETDNFTNLFSKRVESIKDELSNITASKEDKDTAEVFLTILTLVAQAEANKRLAEKLLDEYFTK